METHKRWDIQVACITGRMWFVEGNKGVAFSPIQTPMDAGKMTCRWTTKQLHPEIFTMALQPFVILTIFRLQGHEDNSKWIVTEITDRVNKTSVGYPSFPNSRVISIISWWTLNRKFQKCAHQTMSLPKQINNNLRILKVYNRIYRIRK